MLTTKRNIRLVIIAIAITLATLVPCIYSIYCSSQTQHYTKLQRLLANTDTMLLLIVSQLLSQVFLMLSVCRYCRQSGIKKTNTKTGAGSSIS